MRKLAFAIAAVFSASAFATTHDHANHDHSSHDHSQHAAHSGASVTVTVNAVSADGTGQALGEVVISETAHGLVFQPNLKGLSAGLHGFHIHENPSCDAKEKDGKKTAALAAGGHFDPAKTAKHGTPWGDGHLGDLPALFVDQDGNASNPVLAPRIKSLKDIQGRSLMVHAGGDNHSDTPAALGGGGARAACGVIK